MNVRVVLESRNESGCTTIVPVLPGCINERDTANEALRNIQEAIELHLGPMDEDGSFSPNAEQLEITA